MEWISVEDRLPTNDDRHLVYPPPNPEYGQFTASYNPYGGDYGGKWTYENDIPNWGFESIVCEVTHWMPLPEPPKDENTQ